MANWLPQRHAAGCGCEPCLTGDVVAKRLADIWVRKAITHAIAGRLRVEASTDLQEHVVTSRQVQDYWTRAPIRQPFSTARMAVLAEEK